MRAERNSRKRKVAFLVWIVMFMISIVHFGTPRGVEAKDEFRMRIHHANSPKDARHVALELFKTVTDSRAKGQIKIEIYPSSQLGNESEALRGVMAGTIEAICTCIDGYLPAIVRESNILSIPYLFPSEAVWCEVFFGDFGKEFGDLVLHTTGMRVLGYSTAGYSGIGNNVRPIRRVEDVKGLKIRSMPSPAMLKFISALGGNPVPLTWSEVYGALQHKVIDGLMTACLIWEDIGLQDVLKYGTDTHHILHMDALMVNEKWFKSLPADLQFILKDSTLVWKQNQNGLKMHKQHEAAARLEKKGVEMYILDRDGLKSFKNVTQQPVVDMVVKDTLGGDRTWVDKLLKASKEAEDKVERLWLSK